MSRVDCKRNSVCNVQCNAPSVYVSVVTGERETWERSEILSSSQVSQMAIICDFGHSPEVVDGQSLVGYSGNLSREQ